MVEMNNLPFSTKPLKQNYMWRDLSRRAITHGVPFTGIPKYPISNFSRVNRVSCLAAQEGWVVEFAQATYRQWFLNHLDPGEESTLQLVLGEIGRTADSVLKNADSDEICVALAAATERARSLGIFGAPTFAVGNELFWGDDRLEDAVRWLGADRGSV